MYIRCLDIVLKVTEVLFLSQKHFIFFPSGWMLSNDLSLSSLTLSSPVSSMLLRLSSHLFISDIVIFN